MNVTYIIKQNTTINVSNGTNQFIYFSNIKCVYDVTYTSQETLRHGRTFFLKKISFHGNGT